MQPEIDDIPARTPVRDGVEAPVSPYYCHCGLEYSDPLVARYCDHGEGD